MRTSSSESKMDCAEEKNYFANWKDYKDHNTVYSPLPTKETRTISYPSGMRRKIYKSVVR